MTDQPRTKAIAAKPIGAAGAVALFSAGVIAMATPQVQKWEGRRLYPYYDIVKKLTVCDGETHGIELRPYSNAECDAMTGKAMRRTADGITPCLPRVLPIMVQVAILVTAYNIGTGAFCGSSISRLMRQGDVRAGCNAIALWNKGRINGKLVVVRGLDLRRQAERGLCLKGAS